MGVKRESDRSIKSWLFAEAFRFSNDLLQMRWIRWGCLVGSPRVLSLSPSVSLLRFPKEAA